MVAEALVSILGKFSLSHDILTDKESSLSHDILTDKESNLSAALTEKLLNLLQIKHLRISPYHPQSNEMLDWFNRTRKQKIKKVCKNIKIWDDMLPYLLIAYREAPH